MKEFIIKNSKNVYAKSIGLQWVPRLSTFSTSSAQHIDWHAHDNIEILVCHRGSLRYEFQNRQSATLRPGRFLIIQPHLRHRIFDGIDGHGTRSSIFLKAPVRNTRINGFFSAGEYRNLIAHLLSKRLHPGRVSPDRERDLVRLSHLIRKGNSMDEMEKVELRALVISAVVCIASSNRNGEEKTEKGIVDEAIEWIDDRLHQKFKLDDLVAHIGYGRSRFFTLFKSRTGLAPLEWTIQRRIEKAKQLLSGSNISIKETASIVGFQSPVFFSKTFRAHVGLTPTDWQMREQTPSTRKVGKT